MSVPPGNPEYPILSCPECGKKYKLPNLDISDDDPQKYYCPNCESLVYEADV